MPDEIRFTQAAWRNKRNIVLIEQEFTERSGFLNTVAEVFCACITIWDKVAAISGKIATRASPEAYKR